jgi:hypothetical protein
LKEMTFLQKLRLAPPASFHVLDPAKAKKLKGRTMYIPSTLDVAGAIASIPKGETRTMSELRLMLAALGKAEIACPATTTRYWKWLAFAHDEAEKDPCFTVPWWRVLKNGQPSRAMPGGVERQLAFLKREGVEAG